MSRVLDAEPRAIGNQKLSSSLDLTARRISPFAGMINDTVVIAWRNLKRIPRQLDWLIGVTFMPIMFLMMFRYIFAGSLQAAMPQGVSAVNFLVVGIIVQGVVFSGTNTALGLAMDAKEGLMDRFRALPMSHISVVLGRVLADLCLTVFTTTITLLVAFAVGFRPNASPMEWVMALALMLYCGFVFSWIGAVLAFGLKTVEAVNSIGFSIIMPFTFISSAFTEPRLMPSWLRGFAENQPFTLTVDACRHLLNGYPVEGGDYLLAVVWWTAILVVVMPLAYWMFNKAGEA